MLDLDTLAQRRALSLNEKEETWKKAIWHPDFQKISVNMSDGEVESLLELCPSAKHFECVVKILGEKSLASGESPVKVLQDEAKRAGVSPLNWVKSCVGGS